MQQGQCARNWVRARACALAPKLCTDSRCRQTVSSLLHAAHTHPHTLTRTQSPTLRPLTLCAPHSKADQSKVAPVVTLRQTGRVLIDFGSRFGFPLANFRPSGAPRASGATWRQQIASRQLPVSTHSDWLAIVGRRQEAGAGEQLATVC